MQNVIHWPCHIDVARNVGTRDSELRIFHQVVDIRIRAGNKIVDRQDIPSLCQQTVREMRPEKSRPASDHCLHASSSEKMN
jgi:hypothetical protein